jgi:hypothetical protein
MVITLKLLSDIMADVASYFGDEPVAAEQVIQEIKLQIAGRE